MVLWTNSLETRCLFLLPDLIACNLDLNFFLFKIHFVQIHTILELLELHKPNLDADFETILVFATPGVVN